MKLVTISETLLKKYAIDDEMLHKSGRPCVLIVRLIYKGKRQDFAVPLRSNIPAKAPKNQYFSLPPRYQTKPHNHHGLHYIKMFPISRKYLNQYRTNGNSFATIIKSILAKNQSVIVSECQSYLSKCEHGERPEFSTNIDLLLSVLRDMEQ